MNRPHGLLFALILFAFGCVALPPACAAQSLPGYIPCLGCAEHQEIETRWHRPFLVELAGEGFFLADHFRVEADARDLGMCESDILIRSPHAVGGCHSFSATRAWLIETPLELLLFTSPAWGLERDGHPRWAMALEMVPIVYHGLALRATLHNIHQWQNLRTLLQ